MTNLTYLSDLAGSLDMSIPNATTPIISLYGPFNLSLSGSWSGGIMFQRSFNNGNTWKDVQSFTCNTEQIGYGVGKRTIYRMKVSCAGSGTINIRINR